MPLRSTLRAVLQTVYLASLGSLQSGALLDYATGSLYEHEAFTKGQALTKHQKYYQHHHVEYYPRKWDQHCVKTNWRN